MAGSGHVLVTSGRSGSIKIWPEATLRFAAMEAKIQLPCGQGAVSQVRSTPAVLAGRLACHAAVLRDHSRQGLAGRHCSRSTLHVMPGHPMQCNAPVVGLWPLPGTVVSTTCTGAPLAEPCPPACLQAITSLMGTGSSLLTTPSNANLRQGSRPSLTAAGGSSTSAGGPLGPTLLGHPSEELPAGASFVAALPPRRPFRTGPADDSMALVPVSGPGALVPGGRPSLLHTAGKSGSFKLRGIDLGPWIIEYESVARGK